MFINGLPAKFTHMHSSIVFSFWKMSLDLVGTMLQHHDIAYLRIDGSVSGADRERALRGFDGALKRVVLLMTIGTGAVG